MTRRFTKRSLRQPDHCYLLTTETPPIIKTIAITVFQLKASWPTQIAIADAVIGWMFINTLTVPASSFFKAKGIRKKASSVENNREKLNNNKGFIAPSVE